MYNEEKVSDRILALESHCYRTISVNILVSNVRIGTNIILADITLNFGDSSETIFNCNYPKRFFEDCTEEDGEVFNILPYNIRYDGILRKLQKAELNEEGPVLNDVKTHMGRIVCYWRWMNSPPDEGFAPPSYYANMLSGYLDEAERYLNHLYQFQEGVVVE